MTVKLVINCSSKSKLEITHSCIRIYYVSEQVSLDNKNKHVFTTIHWHMHDPDLQNKFLKLIIVQFNKDYKTDALEKNWGWANFVCTIL